MLGGRLGSRLAPVLLGLLAACGDRGPPNVILISVDTLRADHLSCYGYEHTTSPHVDAWARRSGVVFENAVAQAPWTLPSHVSMLTGLDANRHGVNYSHSVAPQSLVTLAEMLREAGYATAAVTGGSWLDPRFGLGQGFDHYHGWPTPGESEGELEAGVDEALRLMRTLPRPFFLFFHTFEVHDYWARREDKPDPRDMSSFRVDSSELRRLYDRGITLTDAQLRRLLEELGTSGLHGRTLVVFTSDHGEGFGDRRSWGHSHLYDNTLLVPLIVELPGGQGRGRRVSRQVRSVDVVPTVLDAAGLAAASPLDGVSLLPLIEGTAASGTAASVPQVAFSYAPEGNRGVSLRVGGRWKYIFNNGAWSPPHGEEELYRLADDPGEVRSLGAEPSAARELHTAALGYLGQVPGLRLAFANAGASPIHYTVRGAGGLIRRHVVKSPAMPCDCVRRETDDEVRVTVPPDQRFSVTFEQLAEHRFELEASAADDPGQVFRQTFQLEELKRPRFLVRTPSGWALEDAAGVETGVEMRWQGRLDPAAESPVDRDPELRRRLEALGYLE